MSIEKIIVLRHELHQHPEISNKEYYTSAKIAEFMKSFTPDEVISLSTTGKAFVFKGKKPGKTLMFRAELDALPVTESSGRAYCSKNPGIAHACGHDGHMAIIAGLAQKIAMNRPEKGKVVLLFQPAEEVEQGALYVINDPEFKKIEPDYIFALHNIPGAEINTVLLRRGTFAAASKGMTVKLYGKTSHAAEPENGISPANAISAIIRDLNMLVEGKKLFKDMTLLTIIHIRLGEISFGTTPGYAEILITLRSFENEDMELLTRKSEKIIYDIANAENLKCEISYEEVFPALVNDNEFINLSEQSAIENKLDIEHLEYPFKWSEDFAYFTQQYKGCLFGLGAGINHARLHHADYDFPDEIIESGINLFYKIYQKVNS